MEPGKFRCGPRLDLWKKSKRGGVWGWGGSKNENHEKVVLY